jgi:FtsH-binding integral membrane protein
MGALAGLSLVLAHGGIPGLIAETGSVFVALAVFGYFIRRSAKREREQEREREDDPGRS